MNRLLPFVGFICAIPLIVVQLPPASATGQPTSVAVTGDPVPGNATLDAILTPALNNHGLMVFPAFLTTHPPFNGRIDTGVYRGTVSPDPLVEVVRENDLTPDGTRRFSTVFLSPAFNDAGQMAFLGLMRPLSGGFSDDNGIFRGEGGPLTQIVRQGQLAPDGDGTFGGMLGQTSTSFSSPSLNALGQAAFGANLENTTRSTGLFLGSGGDLSQIVRQGDGAPDDDGTFSGFSREPALNDDGQAAFTATLDGTFRNHGVFVGSGGALTQIARTGDAAPDSDGTLVSFFVHNLNKEGQVAFLASVSGLNNRGVFIGSGAQLTQVARTGQSAPDGNGTFQSFLSLSLNNAGQTTFVGRLNGTTEDSGLFLGSDGGIRSIAREGQDAPGGDGQFGDLITAAASLNNTGQAAFTAVITNTADGGDDEAIFVGDGTELVEVVRQGQASEGSTIDNVAALNNSGPLGGMSRRGLNDFGQVAYQGDLADGREGIFLFTPQLSWRSDTGGQWDNPLNWTLSLKPAAVHDVVINPHSDLTVTGPEAQTGVKALRIGGVTGNGSLVLQAGGPLTAESLTVMPNGALTAEIGGTVSDQYAHVTATRGVSLGGTLNLAMIDGFLPQLGEVFPIITAQDRDDEMLVINGVLLGDVGLALAPVYDYQEKDGLTLVTALPGDADLNGAVALGDLGVLLDNLGGGGDWSNADFNGDTLVALADLGIFLDHLGRAAPTAVLSAEPRRVPEPTSAAVMMLGWLVCLRRSRRPSPKHGVNAQLA